MHEIVNILGDEMSDSSAVVDTDLNPARRDSGWRNTTLEYSGDNVPSFFVSKPAPPHKLWDTDDIQFLNKVSCRARLRLTHIDPKNGRFEGRMKVHWTMRTLNAQERTEPLRRVPGIRFPRLNCAIEESRVWRNLDHDSETTVLWEGTTVLSFEGFEMFEVQDFPYDRQVIDLNLFEFVWRDHKDTDRFYEEMHIVAFYTETVSMMPEWECFSAIVEPRSVLSPGSGPTFSSRFLVKLRLQRKERYYITSIFMVTYLITSAASFTLALRPGKRFVGDRLSVLTSGLLTLVSFKYSIAHDLPTVPYTTFASQYLAAQVFTLVAIAGETVIAYKLSLDGGLIDPALVAQFEDYLMCILLFLWSAYFLYARFGKRRRAWDSVLNSQSDTGELKDSPSKRTKDATASCASFIHHEKTEHGKAKVHRKLMSKYDPRSVAIYNNIVNVLQSRRATGRSFPPKPQDEDCRIDPCARIDPLLNGRAVTFLEMVAAHQRQGRPVGASYWEALQPARQAGVETQNLTDSGGLQHRRACESLPTSLAL